MTYDGVRSPTTSGVPRFRGGEARHAWGLNGLSLDARLAGLAPEVKFENPWEATDPVRLVHLLEHTTGWPDISLRVLLLDGKG